MRVAFVILQREAFTYPVVHLFAQQALHDGHRQDTERERKMPSPRSDL